MKISFGESLKGIVAILALSSLLVAMSFSIPAMAVSSGDGIGTPQFTAQPLNAHVDNPTTIPYWSSSFTYNGQTYQYTMVGTDPSAGSVSTTIPVVIIPLNFTFANGVTLDGTTEVASTVASPIFQAASFTSGNTQYGDAMQRAEFWNSVATASPGYHVLLGGPTVLPTQSINVPRNQGIEFTGQTSGQPIGLLSYSWFNARLDNLMVSMHISPTVIPIFITFDTFLYIHSLGNCCVLGYHGATTSLNGNGAQHINTYIYAAYSNPGIFGAGVPIQDINALSHEVAELFNDPFVSNIVPAWSVPGEPQYGCTSYLEVGDPLVGVAFNVNGYHPQDIAFLSWFARATPSTSQGGLYTYLGTFPTYSPSC